MLLCICVFAYSAYQLYLIYDTQNTVKKETEELETKAIKEDDNKKVLAPDWASLKAQNQDIVGWIYMPSCSISYPIVQGTDNDYYLDHTVNGEYNRMGSIFLDYHANSGFEDDNSILYGHSVDIGGMFTSLNQFEDQTFFEENPEFYIVTEEKSYTCTIAFFSQSADGSVYYTTNFGDGRNSVLEQMRTHSLYSRELDLENAKFITLSTCNLDYGFNSNQRLIVTAVIEERTEPVELVE